MAKIEVVGAVFHRDNEILAFERDRGPLAGYWEFPGGKIEPGEDHRGGGEDGEGARAALEPCLSWLASFSV